MDLCVLDDMGLLRKGCGVYSLTPARPIVPRNERVFRQGQPASPAPTEVPPAATPSSTATKEAQSAAPSNSSIDARLDRIDTHIQQMESILQLLVAHFLPNYG